MLDQFPVLLADDDQNDVFIMKRAYGEAGFLNPLVCVQNGKEAVEYLEGSGKFTNRSENPLPCLVMLDLKMPLMDGFDVMAWLRDHPRYEHLPIVVLTGSKLVEDIAKSRDLGVFDYRVKPGGFEDLVKLLADVRQCWLDERFNRFTASHAG